MKTLVVLIALLSGFTAQARRDDNEKKKVAKETIVCKGVKESKGYHVVLVAKSQSNIEDKAIAYWTSIDQPDGVGYEGMIFGYKNDVTLKLKPRANDNVDLSGSIYMDEHEQNLDYKNAEGKVIELTLDCAVQ